MIRMDWQEPLDHYEAWTREKQALDAAQAIVTEQRGVGLAGMKEAGLTLEEIAEKVGLSKARVGQLIAVAERALAAHRAAKAATGPS